MIVYDRRNWFTRTVRKTRESKIEVDEFIFLKETVIMLFVVSVGLGIFDADILVSGRVKETIFGFIDRIIFELVFVSAAIIKSISIAVEGSLQIKFLVLA